MAERGALVKVERWRSGGALGPRGALGSGGALAVRGDFWVPAELWKRRASNGPSVPVPLAPQAFGASNESNREPPGPKAETIRNFDVRRTFPLRVYFVAAFAVSGIYLPYFPPWLHGRGLAGQPFGVVSAAAPAMGLFAPTVFGVIADGLGLRTGLLQFASAGALAAFGALTIAAGLGVPLGLGGLLLAAVAIALFRTPMLLMADVVALEHAPGVGTSYGRLRLWGSLGFLASALVAGCAVDPGGAVAVPLACTLAVAAALGAALALPRAGRLPARPERRGVLHLLAEGDFRLFLFAAFLGNCAQAAYDQCFSLHLFDLGVARPLVGVAWALGTGAEVGIMAYSASLFRVAPVSTLFAFALCGAALRWALLAVVRSSPILLMLQPLHAISFGLVWVAEVAYTSRRFRSSLATAQGLLATAMGAGSVVGMLIWGPVYTRWGGSFVFAGAACFAVCASASAFALDRKVRVPVESSTAIAE